MKKFIKNNWHWIVLFLMAAGVNSAQLIWVRKHYYVKGFKNGFNYAIEEINRLSEENRKAKSVEYFVDHSEIK